MKRRHALLLFATAAAGIGLLLSCGMAKVPLEKAARAFVPYLLVLLAGLAVIVLFPEITLILPRLFFGKGY